MTLQEYAEAIRKGDDPAAVLRVAMAAAESSALERAAQRYLEMAKGAISREARDRCRATAEALRSLIPPVPAPAAEPAPFNFAEVAANDLLQVDRNALRSVDPEKRRKLAAKLLAGLAAEVAAPPEREGT